MMVSAAFMVLVMLQALSGPASAVRAPPANVAVPPPSCVEPKISQRASVAAEDIAYLQTQVHTYSSCIKTYVDARQAEMKAAQAQAQAEADAANDAVRSVNTLLAKVKTFSDQHAHD